MIKLFRKRIKKKEKLVDLVKKYYDKVGEISSEENSLVADAILRLVFNEKSEIVKITRAVYGACVYEDETISERIKNREITVDEIYEYLMQKAKYTYYDCYVTIELQYEEHEFKIDIDIIRKCITVPEIETRIRYMLGGFAILEWFGDFIILELASEIMLKEIDKVLTFVNWKELIGVMMRYLTDKEKKELIEKVKKINKKKYLELLSDVI